MAQPQRILLLIVLAQFMGVSTWFAGNAVLPNLIDTWQLQNDALAWITNAVQLGFILGALLFAILSLADRVRPSLLYFVCAVLGSLVSLLTPLIAENLESLLVMRFIAGFLLAGIYPVGMKIAATWYPEGLGKALGFLVGALVLGTAAPHLFAFGAIDEWRYVLYATSVTSLISGFIILLGVGEGPGSLKPAPLKLSQIRQLTHHTKLRASAGGYFGHMWELYAVWAIAPVWIAAYLDSQKLNFNLSLAAFFVISFGTLGCVFGGIASSRIGSARVATLALGVSGTCCLLSPLAFMLDPLWVALFWFIWGFSVVADSAQFSTLSAINAPKEAVGTALALINSIGFALTLGAIYLLVLLASLIPVQWAIWLLLPGPMLGLWMMRPLLAQEKAITH